MIWQDFIISAAQVVFIVVLIPMVDSVLRKRRDPPPLVTSCFQAIGLAAIAISFASLTLWFSALCAGIVGIMWFLMMLAELANHGVIYLSMEERKQLDQLMSGGWIGIYKKKVLDQRAMRSLVRRGLALCEPDNEKAWITAKGRKAHQWFQQSSGASD